MAHSNYFVDIEVQRDLRRARNERLRQQLIANILEEIEELPPDIFDGELPTHKRPFRRPVRVFPLGECRTVQLDGLAGHTMLYLGENYRLYEYGPRRRKADSWNFPEVGHVDSDIIALRAVDVDKLDIWNLPPMRDALRRLWLV